LASWSVIASEVCVRIGSAGALDAGKDTLEPMNTPIVYVALAPELLRELELDQELLRLRGLAEVERWDGPGRPSAEAVAAALGRAQVLVTGWGVPRLAPLADW